MAADIEHDDLVRFEAHGAGPLTAADMEGWLDHDGARVCMRPTVTARRSSCCMAAPAMPATRATRCRPSCRPVIAPS